jgi:hypothetical protein
MIPKRKKPRRRRECSAKRPSGAIASNRIRQSKAALPKLAERTRATKDEVIRCASPPCYLGEIEFPERFANGAIF